MNPFTLAVCQLGVMVSMSFGSNTVKICHLELSLNLCRFFKVSDQIAFSLHSQFSLSTANHLAAPPLISWFPTCCCPAAERRTVNFVKSYCLCNSFNFSPRQLSPIGFTGDANPSFTIKPMCRLCWFDFPRGSLTLFLFWCPLMKESTPSVHRQECLSSK